MSKNVRFLHNHSQLEQKLGFGKDTVLVDWRYKRTFPNSEPFEYEGEEYLKVNTMEFVDKGGIFKGLMK